MRIVLFFGLLLYSIPTSAQMERTVYQSFNVDSVPTISLDLYGDYEVVAWSGNTILVETHVQIWSATPEILDFFITNGRYEVITEATPDNFNLKHKELTRKEIRTKNGSCTEQVNLRIFIPDTFEWPEGEKKLLHKKPEVTGEVK